MIHADSHVCSVFVLRPLKLSGATQDKRTDIRSSLHDGSRAGGGRGN